MLGKMYRYGLGIREYPLVAHRWLNLASTGGNQRVRKTQDEIASGLSVSE